VELIESNQRECKALSPGPIVGIMMRVNFRN